MDTLQHRGRPQNISLLPLWFVSKVGQPGTLWYVPLKPISDRLLHSCFRLETASLVMFSYSKNGDIMKEEFCDVWRMFQCLPLHFVGGISWLHCRS